MIFSQNKCLKKFALCKKFTLISIDPSINFTGYAIFEIAENFYTCKFFNVINSKDSDNLHTKIRYILWNIDNLVQQYRNDNMILVVEEPTQTIYNQNQPKNTIIARAAKVAQLQGLVHAINGFLYGKYGLRNNMALQFIYPSTWQTEKGLIKKLGSKVWSLHKANGTFDLNLSTKVDENKADAINIGDHFLSNIMQKRLRHD